MTHPRFWPQKHRYRAIDLILEGVRPWQVRAIIEIEAKRPLPRITLWKWMLADVCAAMARGER